MNKETLLDLCKKWEGEANPNEAIKVSEDNAETLKANALADGRKYGINKCADDLRKLVYLLG